MISFDIQAGYRHFSISPAMRDWFVFHYQRFYRCVALPFGWGRSPLWFTQLMVPIVRYLPTKLGYRVLAYLDDLFICPAPAGQMSTKRDCLRASRTIEKLLKGLELTRHPSKGDWTGPTRIEHVVCIIDTRVMKFFISPRKIENVRNMAQLLITQARQGRRWVSLERLSTFCGVCVSLTLPMPYSRFYSRSLYDDMAPVKSQAGSAGSGCGSCCRLSHQSLRDLRTWRKLTSDAREGHPIRPASPRGIMHTDAADLGFGGNFGLHGHP
jgi:hypothetical protein